MPLIANMSPYSNILFVLRKVTILTHVIGVLANTNKNLNITQIFIFGQLFDKDGNFLLMYISKPNISSGLGMICERN
jgi:hypothetical protein